MRTDAPSCRAGGVVVVGAARGESVVIVCEVDADPPAAVFKWKFNNSGETIDVTADRYTSNGSASSLKLVPHQYRSLLRRSRLLAALQVHVKAVARPRKV